MTGPQNQNPSVVLDDFANGVGPVRARAVRGAGAYLGGTVPGEDHGRGLAVQAVLVRRLAAGPHDVPGA